MPQARILVVDDEEDVRQRIGSFLECKINCAVELAANGEEALKKLKESQFDLVLLDIKMPGLSGIDVLRQAAADSIVTKFLAISGYDSQEVADEALRFGAIDFIPKPQTSTTILLKVKDILEQIGKYEAK